MKHQSKNLEARKMFAAVGRKLKTGFTEIW
jgi:hypothetical protein